MPRTNRICAWLLLVVLVPLTACGQDAAAPAQSSDQDHTAEKAQQGDHGGHKEEGHEEGHKAGKAEEEEVHRQGRVHLTKAQRQRLSLEIAPAEAGSAAAIVQAPATVRFDADRVARVGPRLEAKVLEVTKDLGEKVAAGETVAVLDSVQLGRAKARYLTASARFESASANYRRDQKLAERQIVSEAELLDSKASYLEAKAERDAARAELRLYDLDDSDIDGIAVGGEQPLSRYILTAPMAGVIQRRDLVSGQTVSAQETPIHIVNSERMWVMVEAAETDMPRLAPGQKMKLTVRALPGKIFTGKTDWVSRDLDEQSRTVRVRAIVPNEDGLLRAGMFGSARIHTESEQRLALVPVDAVQTVDGRQVVFVPGAEPGAFRAVPVRTGTEADGQVEILSGVKPGERVVVSGAFDLMSALTASGRSAAHGH
ncbi:cation efflux family protein [Salinisphaera sp. PC39]|uniref:efflux RND transporter periplasmic adaptor subunit n=1 Tax=Salinisphaera sp. PC39 TaxID=1304156 RepID=UPI00333E5CBB